HRPDYDPGRRTGRFGRIFTETIHRRAVECYRVPGTPSTGVAVKSPDLCENTGSMTESTLETVPVASAEILAEKIRSRRARVGIVGLGYVGLPLAVEFAKAGFTVTGIDVSEEKVGLVN